MLLYLLLACHTPSPTDTAPPPTFTAVTFNTGTSESLVPEGAENGGYGAEQAALSDQYYGDGLAFLAVMEDARTWLASTVPDVVAFQEIFHPGDCADIPVEAHEGFICERWREGDPTVAQEVLGDGWQVACNPGKPDKCAAVRRDFGTFQGCDADLCLEGLTGFTVEGCGDGARVGRGTVDRTDGGTLTVVAVHGSSGISSEDMDCRTRQFQQVFEDLGDGEPAANGQVNLILGDLNTDPSLSAGYDPSAAYIASQVTGDPFHFLTDLGPDAPPSYAGLLNIDHVVSDHLDGTCRIAGLTEGQPPVSDILFFDHKPVTCGVGEAAP